MSHRDYRISELVAMIENGQLQLPEMQRQYVWTSTKVRDLLDSLYRGYPSGLILMWQTPHDSDVATREFAVAANAAKVGSALLLLDGQQQLLRGHDLAREQDVSHPLAAQLLLLLGHGLDVLGADIGELEEAAIDEIDPGAPERPPQRPRRLAMDGVVPRARSAEHADALQSQIAQMRTTMMMIKRPIFLP